MASLATRCGLTALASGTGVVTCWEVRRQQLLAKVEAARTRYRDTGSETRFPFYGRDFGYEVDYLLELGLQPGDQCHATYNLPALPLTHALAVAVQRWMSKADCDEEALIELAAGQRHCRHPARPGLWWRPWWPGSERKTLTRYCDWLAWPVLGEVRIRRLPGKPGETWCTVR
mmetsp:Transcript_29650/g.66790  ORF Transcript_29650/g.66790 Transcript_29650/m.66790 type:complete len:173 (+) Transcript_29650:51-569(+)